MKKRRATAAGLLIAILTLLGVALADISDSSDPDVGFTGPLPALVLDLA